MSSERTHRLYVAGHEYMVSAETHARYAATMRKYYERLPVADQPSNWPDIQEELRERDAIQDEERIAKKNIRIFGRLHE